MQCISRWSLKRLGQACFAEFIHQHSFMSPSDAEVCGDAVQGRRVCPTSVWLTWLLGVLGVAAARPRNLNQLIAFHGSIGPPSSVFEFGMIQEPGNEFHCSVGFAAPSISALTYYQVCDEGLLPSPHRCAFEVTCHSSPKWRSMGLWRHDWSMLSMNKWTMRGVRSTVIKPVPSQKKINRNTQY